MEIFCNLRVICFIQVRSDDIPRCSSILTFYHFYNHFLPSLCVCLFVYLFVHVSVFISMSLSLYLPVSLYLPACLPIYQSVWEPICLAIHIFVYFFAYLSTWLSIWFRPPVRTFVDRHLQPLSLHSILNSLRYTFIAPLFSSYIVQCTCTS